MLLLCELTQCLLGGVYSLARLVKRAFSLDSLRVLLLSDEIVVTNLILSLSDTAGLAFIKRQNPLNLLITELMDGRWNSKVLQRTKLGIKLPVSLGRAQRIAFNGL